MKHGGKQTYFPEILTKLLHLLTYKGSLAFQLAFF